MLTSNQINNANSLKAELIKSGITNPYIQTAILGIVLKESKFNPAAAEVSYSGTSNDRIRSIFSKTKALTEPVLTELKKDTRRFFDFVYNGIIGNGAGDGYLFRGRGYNQLTGRGNYKGYGDRIGINLVANPDLVSTPEVANKVIIAFMKAGIDKLKRLGKFSGKDINDFPDQKSAYNAVYNINAGEGKNLYDAGGNIKSDTTGGYKKGLDSLGWLSQNVVGLKNAITETTQQATEVVKKNPLKTIAIAAALTILVYTGYKLIKKNI